MSFIVTFLSFQVYNGSTEEPYTNPTAPVHFIIGTGGSREGLYAIKDRPSDLAAMRLSQFGFAHLTAINRSHLTVQQYSDDLVSTISVHHFHLLMCLFSQSGKILDKVTIIKSNHGPYPDRSKGAASASQTTSRPIQIPFAISKPKDNSSNYTSDPVTNSTNDHNQKEILSGSSDPDESNANTLRDSETDDEEKIND